MTGQNRFPPPKRKVDPLVGHVIPPYEGECTRCGQLEHLIVSKGLTCISEERAETDKAVGRAISRTTIQ